MSDKQNKTDAQRYEAKSTSLDAQSRVVRDSFYAQFQNRPASAVESSSELWVKEIFDDKVIIEASDGLWLYPYTIEDDSVAFGEPQKVEVEYKPVKAVAVKSLAVKYLRDENGGAVVGGPLLLWGNPKQLDLQGEYFTPETKTWHDVYKSVPALFHHGLDSTVGLAVMGHRIKAEVKDDGLWVEDWLDTSSEYWTMVKPLLDAEVLYYSPGSAPHLVDKEKDGKLKSFPVVEDTLTPVPAQHRLRPIEQIKAAYLKANLDLPDTLEPEPDPADGGEDAGASCREADEARARADATLILIKTLEG